jgi:cyclopropane fatty-acyl-phospholipid synthase-like methyltransferase
VTPEGESAWWDWVARDSIRLEANVYGDLDADACLDLIVPYLDFDSWIIELGCGVGRLTRPLADRYPQAHIVGVDSSSVMISTASIEAPEVHWVLNNGRDLSDIQERKFHSGYSMTMFQHIPPEAQQGYLAELHRVIQPGGTFRLQFVFEGEEGPMSYPTAVKDMLGWCDQTGWRETKLDLGLLKPEWAWLTLTRL